MRELQRKLDHDIKLKDFFAIKGNVRINAELEAREANRKQMQQELADKQLTDLQNIMKEIQVLFAIICLIWCQFRLTKTLRTETRKFRSVIIFHISEIAAINVL